MALTDQEKRDAAKLLAFEIFQKLSTIAHSDTDNLIAAIGSIDTAMATVINDVPVAWGTKTIKQALIDNLPEPFQANSTAAQKAIALAMWAMEEAGI